MSNKSVHEKVTLLVFEGGVFESEIEKYVGRVRKANVLDLIEMVSEVREINEVILITNQLDLAKTAASLGSIVDINDQDIPFHLGKRMQEVITKYNVENVLYFGGGAAPLIGKEDLTRMAMALKEKKNTVITNSLISADFVAFTSAVAVNNIELPNIDNSLAQLLHNQAGLRIEVLETTLSTSFDIDTMIDAMILGAQPRTGVRTRNVIRQLPFRLPTLQECKNILIDPKAEVLVYGRINPANMDYLLSNARCRFGIFCEENNMRALGRLERKEVKAILGFMLEQRSPREFFSYIEEICDCAFIDTRVLLAHMKIDASTSDRFNSDISNYEAVKDPFLQEFTLQAYQANIPVICGGHCLVNAGIWALLDAATRENLENMDEDKIHRIVVEMGSPICGSTIDTIVNYLD